MSISRWFQLDMMNKELRSIDISQLKKEVFVLAKKFQIDTIDAKDDLLYTKHYPVIKTFRAACEEKIKKFKSEL